MTEIFLFIVNMSITASILAVVILLLRLLLNIRIAQSGVFLRFAQFGDQLFQFIRHPCVPPPVSAPKAA